MRNLAKVLAVASIAATFSFAQYESYEDTENNEPWPTEEQASEQDESTGASESEEAEEATEAKAEKAAVKDTAQEESDDDIIKKVLEEKRARDAARKEEEKQKGINGEDMSAIDQTTSPSHKAQKATAGIGLRADFIIGGFWGTEDLEDGVDEPSGYGFDIGLTARFEMLDILWFTPEILFEAYWLEQDDEAFNREFNQMNLTVPLLFRAALPFYTRVYFEIGPQFSLNLSNNVVFDEDHRELHAPNGDGPDLIVENTFEETEIEQTVFAAGLTMGLGFYIIPDRLAFNVRFYAGLTELFPDAKSQLTDRDDNRIMVGTKLESIKLGLNFWFL